MGTELVSVLNHIGSFCAIENIIFYLPTTNIQCHGYGKNGMLLFLEYFTAISSLGFWQFCFVN